MKFFGSQLAYLIRNRESRANLRALLVTQFDVHRRRVVLRLFRVARSDDRRRDARLAERPTDDGLRVTRLVPVGDWFDLLQRRQLTRLVAEQ